MEKNIPCKRKSEETRSKNTHIRQTDFKIRTVTKNKEGYYMNFQKVAVGRTLPNSLYEATITLIPIPEKDITHTNRKLQASILMNIEAEILNKILATRIQQHSKRDHTP